MDSHQKCHFWCDSLHSTFSLFTFYVFIINSYFVIKTSYDVCIQKQYHFLSMSSTKNVYNYKGCLLYFGNRRSWYCHLTTDVPNLKFDFLSVYSLTTFWCIRAICVVYCGMELSHFRPIIFLQFSTGIISIQCIDGICTFSCTVL